MQRRDLLRQVGAGALGAAALGGTASASPDGFARSDLVADPATARAVLADERDLLAELADEGLVEDASPDALALDRFAMPADEADGVAMSVASDGATTERLLVASRSVAAGDLVVGVLAGSGRAYARLERPDGTAETFGALRDDGASTRSCPSDCDIVCTCAETCCDPSGCTCCELSCGCFC